MEETEIDQTKIFISAKCLIFHTKPQA